MDPEELHRRIVSYLYGELGDEQRAELEALLTRDEPLAEASPEQVQQQDGRHGQEREQTERGGKAHRSMIPGRGGPHAGSTTRWGSRCSRNMRPGASATTRAYVPPTPWVARRTDSTRRPRRSR